MSLSCYLARYCRERAISDDYAASLQCSVRVFERFAGRAVSIDEPNAADLLNRYVLWLTESREPCTAKNRRGHIVTLIRAAHGDGLAPPLGRVRTVKIPESIVEAWDKDELLLLACEAENLTGRFRRSRMRRKPYMLSLILGKFDTALRVGDLMSIERDWIWQGGYLSIVQHKTGQAHRTQFRPETLAAIQETLADDPDRRLIWPLWGRRDAFFRQFKRLVVAAGLKGTSRWLRRSSASYYEREFPGMAWRHLGHKQPGLDRRCYIDPTIAYDERPLHKGIFE